jgi:hypothetical protein
MEMSCRACGSKLAATRMCSKCGEPIKWLCPVCHAIYDHTHVHGITGYAKTAQA